MTPRKDKGSVLKKKYSTLLSDKFGQSRKKTSHSRFIKRRWRKKKSKKLFKVEV